MSEIKAGDTVQLKSGGQIMTVETMMKDGSRAICVWFQGSTKQSATFALVALQKAQKADMQKKVE